MNYDDLADEIHEIRNHLAAAKGNIANAYAALESLERKAVIAETDRLKAQIAQESA